MVLICESNNLQTALPGVLGEIGPIHVNCDVGIADIIERRCQSPMSRPRLQGASLQLGIVEIIARKTVVDYKHETELQFRPDLFGPIERSRTDYDLMAWRQTRRVCSQFF